MGASVRLSLAALPGCLAAVGYAADWSSSPAWLGKAGHVAAPNEVKPAACGGALWRSDWASACSTQAAEIKPTRCVVGGSLRGRVPAAGEEGEGEWAHLADESLGFAHLFALCFEQLTCNTMRLFATQSPESRVGCTRARIPHPLYTWMQVMFA